MAYSLREHDIVAISRKGKPLWRFVPPKDSAVFPPRGDWLFAMCSRDLVPSASQVSIDRRSNVLESPR